MNEVDILKGLWVRCRERGSPRTPYRAPFLGSVLLLKHRWFYKTLLSFSHYLSILRVATPVRII